MDITSTLWNESAGRCDCCGRESKKIWGDLSGPAGTQAVYFVHWTVGAPEHFPNIDLVFGKWGEGTTPIDRDLVSLAYRPSPDGGSFMVIDAQGRPPDDRALCGRALRRNDVVDTPLASHVFALVDALWMTELRISEIRALDEAA